MIRALLMGVVLVVAGCSSTEPRTANVDELSKVNPEGPRTVVCPDCGKTSEVPRGGWNAWRCPECGYHQATPIEIRQALAIHYLRPYRNPSDLGQPVSPVTEQELAGAKQAVRLITPGMRMEQVETALGLSRFASRRMVGGGGHSLSAHYDLGDGHTLDLIYGHRLQSSIDYYVVESVIVDGIAHQVIPEHAKTSD